MRLSTSSCTYRESISPCLANTPHCSSHLLPLQNWLALSNQAHKYEPQQNAKSGRASKQDLNNFEEKRTISVFPGPLVVPHDDLNYDPDCSPQSVKSWAQEKTRNKLDPKNGRETLYVARVPDVTKEVDFMRPWTVPTNSQSEMSNATGADADMFADYLRAFYHGMRVQVLPTTLSWTSWEKHRQPSRRANIPKYIGLAFDGQCTRIRVRSPPDCVFPAQLNLDDIIDAAIEMLPKDAYAICLLIDHDMYENEDDDFCCGRAYGGSRVAVVQSARYNPSLDRKEEIDRTHMWPFSHCKTFIDSLCSVEDVPAKPPTKLQIESSKVGPMSAAINAASQHTPSDLVQESQALWFSRLARTVSHELGHCFGIAHCTYYACNMQGTAGMKEDVRQPPYLCPVCEAKVSYAIAGELQGGGDSDRAEWMTQRCEALRVFCTALEEKGQTSAMWRGLEGWLGERMKSM